MTLTAQEAKEIAKDGRIDGLVNQIIEGNALDVMADMPAESVNCMITSVPYWGLRKYNCPVQWPDGWFGELGLEPTIELYIEHLMMVFDQAKRVLRKDGICFVNIGDSYGGHRVSKQWAENAPNKKLADSVWRMDCRDNQYLAASQPMQKGLPDKAMCNIPEKFCIAMEQHGWIKRCNIIWAKGLSFCDKYSGSCMPDSAKDRPNKNSFEWVYMFTKSKHYWYEQQFEEAAYDGRNDTTLKPTDMYSGRNFTPQKMEREPMERWPNELGRTIRNVWAINPQPFPDAHFATFPEKLVEPMIKMGCPEFVCKKCGKAREKIYDVDYISAGGKGQEKYGDNTPNDGSNPGPQGMKHGRANAQRIEMGYTDCGCNAGWRSGVTLDCFRWFWNSRCSGSQIKTRLYPDRIAA